MAGASLAAVTVEYVPLDVELTALGPRAKSRPLADWLTTFPLVPVVLDPYTHESAQILGTAKRILENYRGAGCRTCWVLACDSDGAEKFLGPWAQDTLTFVDPQRQFISAVGLEQLPAFLMIRQDSSVAHAAQGWNPAQWREVAEAVSKVTGWIRPVIGDHRDPSPYTGTPAAA